MIHPHPAKIVPRHDESMRAVRRGMQDQHRLSGVEYRSLQRIIIHIAGFAVPPFRAWQEADAGTLCRHGIAYLYNSGNSIIGTIFPYGTPLLCTKHFLARIELRQCRTPKILCRGVDVRANLRRRGSPELPLDRADCPSMRQCADSAQRSPQRRAAARRLHAPNRVDLLRRPQSAGQHLLIPCPQTPKSPQSPYR